MYTITKHGKRRLRERQNVITGNALLRSVVRKGKIVYEFKNSFFRYLMKKYRKNKNIRVYGNNIYIFTKNSKKLITTYSVPAKYLPLEKYEIEKEVFMKISTLIKLDGCLVQVKLNSGEMYEGIIRANPKGERTYVNLVVDDKIINIKGKQIYSWTLVA